MSTTPSTDTLPTRPPRRGLRAIAVLVAVAGIAGAGWAVGRSTVSPEERKSAVRPPRPTVLTATVVRQVLADELTIRVTATPAHQVEITANPAISGAKPVVTDLPVRAGQPVAEGQRVLSVTGRPVLVLGGDLDPYRDLLPGMIGPDIAQLESALARLGLLAEPPDATYGEATKAAIRALYERAGADALIHEPDGATEPELFASLNDAQREVDAASAAADRTAWSAATQSRASARAALEEFRAATGPIVPVGEVAFVQGLPLAVSTVSARRGKPLPSGASVTLQSGSVVFRSSVSQPARDRIKPGLTARVVADADGTSLQATVATVAERPGTTGFAVALTPTGAVPNQLVDAEARAVIRVGRTKQAVLAVPVSALVSRSDGSVVVLVERAGKAALDVTVSIGLDADGLVEVTNRSGRLHEGDRVVIGR